MFDRSLLSPEVMNWIVLLTIVLPLGVFGINLRNNACSSILSYYIAPISSDCRYNPDVLSDVPSMARRYHYNVETYNVLTDDRYILTVFRINKYQPTKPPVFIQHGIVSSSAPWVDIANRSIAFQLADKGYDVWLGNLRGSTYSNLHESLNVDMPEYWNFNMDVLVQQDIPIQLNLVSQVTGRPGEIIFIGHSMGATLIFMHGAEFPQENQNLIQGIVALAPVTYLHGVPLMELAAPFFFILSSILPYFHITGLFYWEDPIHTIFTFFCTNVFPPGCLLFINLLFGRTVQFPPEDLPLFTSYWPSGVSLHVLEHYFQITASHRFQKFDYGEKLNMRVYGQSNPPIYNLSDVRVPVRFFYGESDNLYDGQNLQRMFNEIGSTNKDKYSAPSPDIEQDFNHFDFLYSQYMDRNLYDKLFHVLESQFHESAND